MPTELFVGLCSIDHVGFNFKSLSYKKQLAAAQGKTASLCGMRAYHVLDPLPYVKVVQLFDFLGGSLGCAEGEKLSRACDYCIENRLPLVIEATSGGVRMQEGVVALMQMSSTACSLDLVKAAGLPIIVIIKDPCYGGTSGSFATLGDLTFGIANSRFGFAGQNVIKNTMFGGNQEEFDRVIPPGFQTTDRAAAMGSIDRVFDTIDEAYDMIHNLFRLLTYERCTPNNLSSIIKTITENKASELIDPEDDSFIYSEARNPARPSTVDYVRTFLVDPVSLRVDSCITVSFGRFAGSFPIAVITTSREGNDLTAGLGSPIGYRFVTRMVRLISRVGIPILTLVDTAGALPSPEAEEQCQSRAIAECLQTFQAAAVPIISIITGEGGSGGALALAGGNYVGILSRAFYNVISPEGGASILQPSIYGSDTASMRASFVKDAELLARCQKCYPSDLKQAGVVDGIIKGPLPSETRTACEETGWQIALFFALMLKRCLEIDNLQRHRNARYRRLAAFEEVREEDIRSRLAVTQPSPNAIKNESTKYTEQFEALHKLALFLTDVAHGEHSKLSAPLRRSGPPPPIRNTYESPHIKESIPSPENIVTCKTILRTQGAKAVCDYIVSQGRLFITETTFRDAHQSLLATRLRTRELLEGMQLLQSTGFPTMQNTPLFSIECWGGATFDVTMRFLDENPYERLEAFTEALPNTLTQMLIRGANAVGYKSYDNEELEDFIVRSAKAGVDVFRVFDAFNNLNQMERAINTLLTKCQDRVLCEVCICFTGDFLSTLEEETVYTLEYYGKLAAEIATRWPDFHILCIKDMAGLLRPAHAVPLMQAIRAGIGQRPVHFHTHDTSGSGLCSAFAMARAGCNIVDLASSSLSGLTAQPPLQTFIQLQCSEEKGEACNGLRLNLSHIDQVVKNLRTYDGYWRGLRKEYHDLDTTFPASSPDVYAHEMPGGQITNLYQQCCGMGLGHHWDAAMDLYAECNRLMGNIVKVTPSSKVVGDLALFLLSQNLTADAIVNPDHSSQIDWPASLIELLNGKLGLPHHGFPLALLQTVLKLSRADAEQHLQRLKDQFLTRKDFYSVTKITYDTVENTSDDYAKLCSTMYPQVYSNYMERVEKYGTLPKYLPADVYRRGLTVGESCFVLLDDGLLGSVKLVRLHNTNFACTKRNFEYRLAISQAPIRMTLLNRYTLAQTLKVTPLFVKKDLVEYVYTKMGESASIRADPSNKAHVAAMLPGVVEDVLVSIGQVVREGEPLLRVGSAKLDLIVTSPHAGNVIDVLVGAGDTITPGVLLAIVCP